MTLWLILFLLVVGISFILALQSMREYQEIPRESRADYGLFLVRQPERFDAKILASIHQKVLVESLILSVERLFKGSQSALTIFGPTKVLLSYNDQLNLLELEDYAAGLRAEDIAIWEVGLKNTSKFNPANLNNIFYNLSQLGEEEQFFWQVVLSARKDEEKPFQTQIRAAVYCQDPPRRKVLASDLQTIALGELTKVPRPFSTQQMLDAFKQRSLSKDSQGPIVSLDGALSLLKI